MQHPSAFHRHDADAAGDGDVPLPPEARSRLRACLAALQHSALPGDVQQRAADLFTHLLALHDAGRLTPAFLALALHSLQGIGTLEALVRPLAEAAQAQARAAGHREFQGHTGSPWQPSGLGRLR